MDFTDEMARLVILIGIPYPPFKDEKIVLKTQYLKERNLHVEKRYRMTGED